MMHRQLQAKESNISSGIDWNDAYGRATVINIAGDILGRKWWSWVPVVADVSLSRSVIIHCGSSQVGWEDLLQLWTYLKSQGLENNRLLTNNLFTTLNMVRTSYAAGTRLDLTQLLLQLSAFDSPDYRDRVATALAVRDQNTRDSPPKNIFLRSASEVQVDIASACLGLDQSLNFLSLAGLGAEATSGSSSWLPDLAYTQPAWKPRDIITQSSYRNLVFNPSTSARQDNQIRQRNTTVFNAAGALQDIAALPTITISPIPTLHARVIIIDTIQQIPSTPLGRSTPSLLKTWEILLSYFFGTLEPFQSLTDRWTARMTPHILNPTSKRNSPSYVECLVDGNKEHCELRRELFRKARDKLLESVPAWDSIRGPMRQRYLNSAPVTSGGNPTQEAYFLTILTSRTSSTQPSSSPDSPPPGSPHHSSLPSLRHIPRDRRRRADPRYATTTAIFTQCHLLTTATRHRRRGRSNPRAQDLCPRSGKSPPTHRAEPAVRHFLRGFPLGGGVESAVSEPLRYEERAVGIGADDGGAGGCGGRARWL